MTRSGAGEGRDLTWTRQLVMTGLLAAVTCWATMAVAIPSPTGGYMNLGDAVVLLEAYLLGPVWGALAAGIGAMLADVMTGYMVYAPATLVIKAVMAALAALLYRRLKGSGAGVAVTGVIGELPMVAGYWLFDSFLTGSLAGAAAGIPSNLVQAAFGVAVSTLLTVKLRKNEAIVRQFPRLG